MTMGVFFHMPLARHAYTWLTNHIVYVCCQDYPDHTHHKSSDNACRICLHPLSPAHRESGGDNCLVCLYLPNPTHQESGVDDFLVCLHQPNRYHDESDGGYNCPSHYVGLGSGYFQLAPRVRLAAFGLFDVGYTPSDERYTPSERVRAKFWLLG